MSNKAKRGEAMRKHNDEVVKKRLLLIERILTRMEKGCIKPKNLTAISEYVAAEVADKTGTPCSAGTLRRNEDYRGHIDKFMQKMGYAEAPELKLQDSKLQLQLEIRRLMKVNKALETENKALETSLSQAYADQAQLEYTLHDAKIEKIDSDQPAPLDESVYFSVLLRILSKVGIDTIDTVNGMVIDDLTDHCLFDKYELPRFFE